MPGDTYHATPMIFHHEGINQEETSDKPKLRKYHPTLKETEGTQWLWTGPFVLKDTFEATGEMSMALGIRWSYCSKLALLILTVAQWFLGLVTRSECSGLTGIVAATDSQTAQGCWSLRNICKGSVRSVRQYLRDLYIHWKQSFIIFLKKSPSHLEKFEYGLYRRQ